MRAVLAVCLISYGCAPLPPTSNWRKLDEGSFTIEIPIGLRKQPVIFMRSRGEVYASSDLWVEFDESSLEYMKETYTQWHDDFEKEYVKRGGEPAGSEFFLKVGDQYGKVTIGTNGNWMALGRPGKQTVHFFCPNSNGSCLDILVSYRSDKPDTAMRIIKSVRLK
jgi:hypothetical protein